MRLLASLLLLAVMPITTATLSVAEGIDSKQLSERHLKKLRDDINDLQAFLKKAQDDHKDLVTSLRKSDEEVAQMSKQVESLKKALQEERDRLKKLKAEQASLSKSQHKQQRVLNDIILASYKLGQEPQLKMLLNQQDPAQVSRNLNYLQYFNAAHQNEIDQYRTTLNELSQVQHKIETREASLQTNLSELKRTHAQLKQTQKQQQAHANALDKKIQGSGQQLSRLQQDRQNLMELLGKVEEVFLPYERNKESRPFKQLKGKLPSPINSRAQKLFGQWQPNGKQRWQGWIYPEQTGSEVFAVHHGRVVFSDWLRGFGLLTIVDHGQGYMTLYARNQALLKSVGDWVETGEVIANVGRSGGFEDTGLYFEIRHKGEPQNPKRWLKG
ncbi:murein hydrolase activator EnvC family protein [Bermanella sp. WJH001]|uniref:murein hydrolase activator EnvC family protein n=1 Tax=Bermanella sp. WJH001 TaxID=3048005 RepID=UPI0024BDC826|nr:peptidoglycan DD-metalloendopeptidase family protein [Bermanella sp. WJH001]MDJ1538706.1 peptidoglycan DD-metalloendopeptidase family protein [Bermanella sp. WJH001]